MASCLRSKPPPLEQPAPRRACREPEPPFALAAPAALVEPPALACSERYGTLLQCGGRAWLLRRVEMRLGSTIHHDTWQTVLRSRASDEPEDRLSPPVVTLPSTLNMSHNAAFVCVDGDIVAWGGRRKAAYFRKPYDEPGIFRAVGKLMDDTIVWGRPELVLDGSPRSGCEERRVAVARVCEFDGKLSVARLSGRFYLYARANLGECGGRRHVQVTSSMDGRTGWDRWKVLYFEGFELGDEDGIYFAAVRPTSSTSPCGTVLEQKADSWLVAHMPGVIGGVGGLYCAVSHDGHHWSKPSLLFASEVLTEGRTSDYPIDGAVNSVKSGIEVVYVEHNVQLAHGLPLSNCAGRPFICKYEYHRMGDQGSNGKADGKGKSIYDYLLTDATLASPVIESASASIVGCGKSVIPGQTRHALLLRGEAFRWGCSEAALNHQRVAARSYVGYAEEVERSGACVDVFLVIDDEACGKDAQQMLQAEYGRRLKAASVVKHPENQGQGVLAAFSLYRKHIGSGHDYVALGRHDVRLLSAPSSWGCGKSDKIGFASRCEALAWRSYRCINDIFFLIHQSKLENFISAVGSSKGANPDNAQCGCFDASCSERRLGSALMRSFHKASGHDCYNVLTHLVGESTVEFCWPDVNSYVSEPNAHYELPRCNDIDPSAAYRARACRHGRLSTAKPPSLTRLAKLKHSTARKPASGQETPHIATPDQSLVSSALEATHRVAVCLTGQLRVAVQMKLHVSLKTNVVEPLRADVFMHVDKADTREWGGQRTSSETEFEEVRRVLRPKLSVMVSYLPPSPKLSACEMVMSSTSNSTRTSLATVEQVSRGRLCYAHDCGSFRCGCYLPGCTRCDVTRYVPQHAHNEACLQLALEYERRTRIRYDFFVKVRPDLSFGRPFPPVYEITSALLRTSSSPICMVGKYGGPLAQGKPLDDKFALMPRDVALVYLNATAAFYLCAERDETAGSCLSGAELKSPDKGMAIRVLRPKLPTTAKMNLDLRGSPAQSLKRKLRNRSLQQQTPEHSPYWATPQCILSRYVLSKFPSIEVVPCVMDAFPIRLVRPMT